MNKVILIKDKCIISITTNTLGVFSNIPPSKFFMKFKTVFKMQTFSVEINILMQKMSENSCF